jgi:hypothetical protein
MKLKHYSKASKTTISKVAKTEKEVCSPIETGFEYVRV